MLCHQLVHEHQSYHGFDHWYRCHSKATKTPEWDFFFHFVQTYHFNFHKTWDRVTFKNTSITLYNIYCHLKGNQITILKDLGNHKKLGEPLRKYTVVTWLVDNIGNWKNHWGKIFDIKRGLHKKLSVDLPNKYIPRGTTQGSWRPRAISSVSFFSLVTVFCFLCTSITNHINF